MSQKSNPTSTKFLKMKQNPTKTGYTYALWTHKNIFEKTVTIIRVNILFIHDFVCFKIFNLYNNTPSILGQILHFRFT